MPKARAVRIVQHPLFLPILLIVWGLTVRSLYFTSNPFGFDQIQIAENAAQIAQGDLKLIGPRTGPAEMFTGPLIYYLAAPLTLIMTPALATILVSIIISLITGCVIYWLTNRYLTAKLAMTSLILWAFSPLLIHFDRISWNPNLTLLAASCVFFPMLKRHQLKLIDLSTISIGIFLGYQAHFSGLLLLPLALITLSIRRELKKAPVLVLGLLLSLLPTFIFDYRHQWLNLTGFINLISNNDAVSVYALGYRLFQKIYIVLETIGKYLFDTNQTVLIVWVGIIIAFNFFWRNRPFWTTSGKHRAALLSLVWLAGLSMAFALYRSSTPEYYFFPLLPVIIYMLADVLNHLLPNQLPLIMVLGIYATLFTLTRYPANLGLSYGNLHTIARQLAEYSQQQPLKSIMYDMEPVDALGLKYIVDHAHIPTQTSGINVHLSYPATSALFTTTRVGNIAIWLDPRQSPDYAYTNSATEIIGVPHTWQVSQIQLPALVDSSLTHYQLIIPGNPAISLIHLPLKSALHVPERNYAAVSPINSIPLKNNSELLWQPANFTGQDGYYLLSHPHGYFIATQSSEIISQIEITTAK